MKWFLLLATLVGGLTVLGSASTANAYGYRVRYTPYGYRAVYRPRYAYPAPYVLGPGVVVAGPRVGYGVGVAAPMYGYPAGPMYAPGVAPGYYGW